MEQLLGDSGPLELPLLLPLPVNPLVTGVGRFKPLNCASLASCGNVDPIPLPFTAAAAAFARSCLNEVVKSLERAAAAAAAGHMLGPLGELVTTLERVKLEHALALVFVTGIELAILGTGSARLGKARLNLEAQMRGKMLAVFTSMIGTIR